jgi:hypothetical protein
MISVLVFRIPIFAHNTAAFAFCNPETMAAVPTQREISLVRLRPKAAVASAQLTRSLNGYEGIAHEPPCGSLFVWPVAALPLVIDRFATKGWVDGLLCLAFAFAASAYIAIAYFGPRYSDPD